MIGTDGLTDWRKPGFLAVICLVVTLGELRGTAAEAVASTEPPFHPTTDVAYQADAAAPLGADDGPSTTTEQGASTDDARLVPAIYAWNPAVRFVYFRHVSKWM